MQNQTFLSNDCHFGYSSWYRSFKNDQVVGKLADIMWETMSALLEQEDGTKEVYMHGSKVANTFSTFF